MTTSDFDVTKSAKVAAESRRRPWVSPKVIVSHARQSGKLQSPAIGYEYHETAPGGGGTTNIS